MLYYEAILIQFLIHRWFDIVAIAALSILLRMGYIRMRREVG